MASRSSRRTTARGASSSASPTGSGRCARASRTRARSRPELVAGARTSGRDDLGAFDGSSSRSPARRSRSRRRCAPTASARCWCSGSKRARRSPASRPAARRPGRGLSLVRAGRARARRRARGRARLRSPVHASSRCRPSSDPTCADFFLLPFRPGGRRCRSAASRPTGARCCSRRSTRSTSR